MKRNFQITAAILLAGIVVLAWRRWDANRLDPVQDGRHLSEWLEELTLFGHLGYHPDDIRAVRSAGTNAIPLLLQYISADDDSLFRHLKDRIAPNSKGLITPTPLLNMMGEKGFEVLGPLGQPAVPELMQLLAKDAANRHVITALGSTRDPRALAVFKDLLSQPEPQKKRMGLAGIRAMEADASPMEEELIQLSLSDPDINVRTSAIYALGRVGTDVKTVPYLIQLLQNSTNDDIRFMAATALANFPNKAQDIRPVLQQVRQTAKSRQVSLAAEIGLQELDEAMRISKLKGPANAVK